jgi:hypothetical protein
LVGHIGFSSWKFYENVPDGRVHARFTDFSGDREAFQGVQKPELPIETTVYMFEVDPDQVVLTSSHHVTESRGLFIVEKTQYDVVAEEVGNGIDEQVHNMDERLTYQHFGQKYVVGHGLGSLIVLTTTDTRTARHDA